MIKEKNIVRSFLIAVVFLVFTTLNLVLPQQAKAFSVQQVLSPATSVLLMIGEKVQYVFAFTPSSKVKVLESQAQRRLASAQGRVKGDTDSAESLIEEYQDIKNKQSSLLDKADDDTLKQVQEQTVEQQKTLVSMGNSAPEIKNTVKTVNTNVVNDIKGVVTLKEGTTAGEAFSQKATIVYAPGTGPGAAGSGGVGTRVIEGGVLQMYASGADGNGGGGQTVTNEKMEMQNMAPANSETNTGATNVIDNNTGSGPGTSGGGDSSGGMGIEAIVGD